MRIGLNLLYMIPDSVGGSETYASGVIHGLSQIDHENEYVVFLNQESSNWPLPEATNFQRVVCPVSATKRSRRYSYEQLLFPAMVSKYDLDLLHSLSYMTPFVLPCKSLVSIYDIVTDYPGAFSFVKKQLLKLLLNISALSSDHIVTLSEASRDQIISKLNVKPQKITATLLAPRTRKMADEGTWTDLAVKLGIQQKYIFALSSQSPSKNIPMLFKAFARLLAESGEDVQLILAGHEPKRGPSLRELAASLGVKDSIVFCGYISDADLSLILRHATIFVFPSLHEGFGLPILEAMEAGIPVACSNVASLPEVAGDGALLFDPHSPEEVLMALKQLLVNPALRDELVLNGYRNLERFSWTTTGEKTLEVYRRIVSSSTSTRLWNMTRQRN